MDKKFSPINIPYGYCLNPSGPENRNPYPGSATYGSQPDPCLNFNNNKINLAPGLYYPPGLDTLNKINEPAINSLDHFFLNGTSTVGTVGTVGTSQFTQVDYSIPSLQTVRPPETFKNSYINLASDTLHVLPDAILSVFFSDSNIDHLRGVVVQKVKEITGQSGVAGSPDGVTIMTPSMDDFFHYMINIYKNYTIYNGSICFVNLQQKSDIKTEISKLNSNILQDYISKMVSQINMYIYYYKDASQIPEQLSVPVLTSMKGSKSLEYNAAGFMPSNSMGIASYNEVGNIM